VRHAGGREADTLYRLVEDEVVPLYYARGPDGLPHGWFRVGRRAIQTAAPTFSARRMVKEYMERLYVSAAQRQGHQGGVARDGAGAQRDL
jgi:glucan phosphorylase